MAPEPVTPEPVQDWPPATQAVRDSDVTWAMLGYLGAIFLGPLIPLAVYLIRRKKSLFLRYHAARALNMALTVLLYLVCCLILGALLALDTITLSLIVAIPLVALLWLLMLRYLVRGAGAAQRGESYEIPGWFCAIIVKLRLRNQGADDCVREQAATAGQHQVSAGEHGQAVVEYCPGSRRVHE